MPDQLTMDEVLREVVDAALDQTHTVIPGRVQSWNRTLETADVEPLVKRPDGSTYSIVRSAKVVFPGAYWDIDAGETGLLLFGQWDFSRWWRTGTIGDPEQLGRHSVAAATFLPGLRRKAESRAVPSGATVLAGDDVRLGVDTASEAVIRGDAYTGHEDTFLAGLLAWVNTIETFLYGGPVGVFQPIITAFRAQLSGDLSTKVSVD